jgi:DNA-binding beta-propeller fold protein YncE
VKPRTPLVCLLLLLPALLPAQTFDFNAARSAEQLRLGVQAFHRGLFNNSWTSLEKAISYQPSNSLAQIWLGRTQWKAGYEQEALRTWQQVVDAGNGSALIRDWISVLTYRRGIGRELSGGKTWAVSSVMDGMQKSGYSFRRPTSVRARDDGTFWVVAFGSNEILHFNANFRLLESLKGGLQGFDHPYDIAETADGGFFVSEYGANRIARVNARGDKVGTFGTKGRADGMMLGPQYMTIDSRGYLWVTDWGNSRVERFDTTGKFLQSITGIPAPTGIAAHEDLLYVSEKSGKHVLVYDLNGNAISTIGDGTLNDPEGLSFTPSGTLLVADGNRILECDLSRETWTVRSDTSASTKRLVQQVISSNGNILAVDFDQSLVLLLTDASTLYAGLVVRVDRVNSVKFPEVYADVSVETRGGAPVMGLGIDNFIVSEARAGVKSPVIAQSNTAARPIDVALVVERSPDIEQSRPDVQQAVADLYGLITQVGRITAVSAADKPVLEAGFGETRLRFIRQSLQAPPSARWRFDLAAKLAGDELITAVSGAKRAIVFLSSGAVSPQGFTTYSLLETAAYMRNNGIAFYPVLAGAAAPDENLSFLASQTGGKVYSVSSPGGMQEVVREIRGRVIPVYTLHYTSLTPPDFGDRYIPLEIEVTVQKVSGRDESGYYAPPTTGLPPQ